MPESDYLEASSCGQTSSFPEQVEAAHRAIADAETTFFDARRALSALLRTCVHARAWHIPDGFGGVMCSVCGHDV